jgi:exonuclease SbcC
MRTKQRREVEKRFNKGTQTLSQLEERAQEIQTELTPFADLDQRIGSVRAKRDDNAADHRRYLEHNAAAEHFDEHTAKWKQLESEQAGEQEEEAKLIENLETLRNEYDRGVHDRLKADHENLARDQAGIEARLAVNQERTRTLESEIAALSKKEKTLKSAEEEHQQLIVLSEVLEFIRKVVREAGPYVTRALVQVISLEAQRIYAEIMGDHTQRLQWNEDYSISIEQDAEERVFAQLSGGEKMASALAVRLALLREMSQIRLAFFDEPTANMDNERRENLAEQITQITGFDQLFVISHDDTFERETHHVIRVSKDGSVSKVETG